MGSNITLEELLQEITRLQENTPEGFTVEEMVEQTGKRKETCRTYLKQLIKAGKVKHNGERTEKNISDRPYKVPVYIII